MTYVIPYVLMDRYHPFDTSIERRVTKPLAKWRVPFTDTSEVLRINWRHAEISAAILPVRESGTIDSIGHYQIDSTDVNRWRELHSAVEGSSDGLGHHLKNYLEGLDRPIRFHDRTELSWLEFAACGGEVYVERGVLDSEQLARIGRLLGMWIDANHDAPKLAVINASRSRQDVTKGKDLNAEKLLLSLIPPGYQANKLDYPIL